MSHLRQSFSVKFEYNVYFTSALFDTNNNTLSDFFKSRPSDAPKKIYFVIDQGVADAHPGLTTDIKTFFANQTNVQLIDDILIVPGGETLKNDTALFDQIVAAVDTYGIDRHSYIAAIGGGAVLSILSVMRLPFRIAASSTSASRLTALFSKRFRHRGKEPDQLQAQKEFPRNICTPPVAVFNDEDFLATLSDRDYRSGISEAVKVALIKDADFFCWLEANTAKLAARDREAMNYLIKHCAKLHMDHIAGDDPFETGSARPLDFGHWAAHKQEQLSNFSVLHGEAVAMGIALDSVYSYFKGMLTEEKAQRILKVLTDLNFGITDDVINIRDTKSPILKGLAEFQEHLGGILTITLLTDLGTGQEVHEMDHELLIAASKYVAQYSQDKKSLTTIH